MVRHTQIIRRQFADEVLERVRPFCGVGTSRVKNLAPFSQHYLEHSGANPNTLFCDLARWKFRKRNCFRLLKLVPKKWEFLEIGRAYRKKDIITQVWIWDCPFMCRYNLCRHLKCFLILNLLQLSCFCCIYKCTLTYIYCIFFHFRQDASCERSNFWE